MQDMWNDVLGLKEKLKPSSVDFLKYINASRFDSISHSFNTTQIMTPYLWAVHPTIIQLT